MNLLAVIALVVGCYVAPGVALSACTSARWSWPLRLLVGFTLGILVVPLVTFSAAWALETSVTLPLQAASAAVVSAFGAGGAWLQRRKAKGA